jgi:hypothetical protein
VDEQGHCFELMHFEWDSTDVEKVLKMKKLVEAKVMKIDWQKAADDLIKRKDEWFPLPFFEQSDWKCKYFDMLQEQFKNVLWEW